MGSLRRLCESFDTRVHCDLASPVGATSRATAGTNFKSKTLQGSTLTGWLNAETELGAFLSAREKRKKGAVGEKVLHLSGDTTKTGLRVSIVYVKLNHTIWHGYEKESCLLDLARPFMPVPPPNWETIKWVTHYKAGCTKIRQRCVYSSLSHIIHTIQPNRSQTPVSMLLNCVLYFHCVFSSSCQGF